MISIKKLLNKIFSKLYNNDIYITTLKNRDKRSSTETCIGVYNGDKLYRKIYSNITLAESSEWSYPSTLPLPNSYKKVVNIYGSLLEPTSPGCRKGIPYFETVYYYLNFIVNPNYTNLGYKMQADGYSQTVDIVIEYTKTS